MSNWKQLSSAKTLRLRVLKALHSVWEKRPGPDDYFPANQILDRATRGLTVDGSLFEGVVKGLLTEGFASAREVNSMIFMRITDQGRAHLEALRDTHRTRALALIGAITGVLSFVKSLVEIAWKH